jgi:excisionase family DNA binding protein
MTQPEYLDVAGVRARYGIGKTKVYEALNSKEIEARKLGSKTLIRCASIDAWLARQPVYGEAA